MAYPPGMRAPVLLLCPWLLVGCGTGAKGGPAAGGGGGDGGAPGPDTGDTAPPVDPGPQDLDQDGHTDTTDCDDTDPGVFPGQTERWNNEDDDCDGYADADGPAAGEAAVDAEAIYEGRTYRWSLLCPAESARAGGRFTLTVTCTPPAGDAEALLLLGETMTLVVDAENAVREGWAGPFDVRSSGGWDAEGSAVAVWPEWTRLTAEGRLDTTSLDLRFAAALSR